MEYGRQNPQYSENSSETKAFSILSYIGILWIVGLLAERGNPKVRFHVNQGIILSIFEFIFKFALFIVQTIINLLFILPFRMFPFISHLGSFINGLLSFAFWGLSTAYIIIGITHAAQNKQEPLPIIGSLFTVIH